MGVAAASWEDRLRETCIDECEIRSYWWQLEPSTPLYWRRRLCWIGTANGTNYVVLQCKKLRCKLSLTILVWPALFKGNFFINYHNNFMIDHNVTTAFWRQITEVKRTLCHTHFSIQSVAECRYLIIFSGKKSEHCRVQKFSPKTTTTSERAEAHLVENDEESRQPMHPGDGIQQPEAEVGWLGIAGVALRWRAVAEHVHGEVQHGRSHFEVPVQHRSNVGDKGVENSGVPAGKERSWSTSEREERKARTWCSKAEQWTTSPAACNRATIPDGESPRTAPSSLGDLHWSSSSHRRPWTWAAETRDDGQCLCPVPQGRALAAGGLQSCSFRPDILELACLQRRRTRGDRRARKQPRKVPSP